MKEENELDEVPQQKDQAFNINEVYQIDYDIEELEKDSNIILENLYYFNIYLKKDSAEIHAETMYINDSTNPVDTISIYNLDSDEFTIYTIDFINKTVIKSSVISEDTTLLGTYIIDPTFRLNFLIGYDCEANETGKLHAEKYLNAYLKE